MQGKSYELSLSEALVIRALKESGHGAEAVRSALLKAGVLEALYAAEKKRAKFNDWLPSLPDAWVRGLLGGILGAIGTGLWLGIFASSVNIPVALAVGAVLGAVGGAVSPDPNASVGCGQLTQVMFDDVKANFQKAIEEYMCKLKEDGYIHVKYKQGYLDDVNMFSQWEQFWKLSAMSSFLEDFVVFAALLLNTERAYKRGKELNRKIPNVKLHRTIKDAIQFGIAGYKGVNMAEAQEDAGVLKDNTVSDATYDALEVDCTNCMDEDDKDYVAEVYEAIERQTS